MEKTLYIPQKIEDSHIIQIYEVYKNLDNIKSIKVYSNCSFKGFILYDEDSWYWIKNANFTDREAYDSLEDLLYCFNVFNPKIVIDL